ncbi:kinesin-like protein KIF28P [Synchiropus picturatus]
MVSNSITIQDPRDPQSRRSFSVDFAYWSHSGFTRDPRGLFRAQEEGGRYADQVRCFLPAPAARLPDCWLKVPLPLQDSVFQDLGEGVLLNALQGYNATLLAYGQTGSGKSYSMVGYGPNKGLVPKLCERLFQTIRQNQDSRQCQVFFSMLEIYNEQVVDLLSPGLRAPGVLRVREEQSRGFYVEGLRTVPCDGAAQVEQLMEQGTRTRTTAATHTNASSSRSHMLIMLQLKQIFTKENLTKHSNIHLVDLAGSERQRCAGPEASDRLKEGSAINLSLTTLGNVISALADLALGKKAVHVPYRDSVLTKLLQPALGGNSRTVMMATLSPADLCYEESLSTLRYAERAKRIQNRAVVNESPTERLVKELKAENARLVQRLSRLDQEGRGTSDETKELRQLLTHNQLQIRAIQTLWEQHLQEALKDWEQQYADITQERRMVHMFPYLVNVNEDPQLSGVVKLFIQDGEWGVGLSDSGPGSICIRGLGIQERHAVFRNERRRVTLRPLPGSKVLVNGKALCEEGTELRHLDRLILGSNCTYLFMGFPCERGSDDWTRLDYDFFQSEVASAAGIRLGQSLDLTGAGAQADPALLAIFHDYSRLVPLVAEANQMSAELDQGAQFRLEIKNLVLSDCKGHDLKKELVVRVTSTRSRQVWIWSKSKFVHRKFLMEEVYRQQLHRSGAAGAAPPVPRLPRESDPFWDPVEPLLLGTAHLWLQTLAFLIPLEEQLEVLGSEGSEEAVLQVQLLPCCPAGLPLSEDHILIDPSELLGRRLDFLLVLDQCCGLSWVRENRTRGVQVGFRMPDCPRPLFSPAMWRDVNPQLDHRVHFAAPRTSQGLLDFLQSSALVLELWGLQGEAEGGRGRERGEHSLSRPVASAPDGCAELATPAADEVFVIEQRDAGSDAALSDSAPGPTAAELQRHLRDLRDVNESLRRENRRLREELGRRGGKEPAATGGDGEFARSLKLFYHSMSAVRGQLQRLRRHQPSVSRALRSRPLHSPVTPPCPQDDSDLPGLRRFVERQRGLLGDLWEQLEGSVSRLKLDVAAIVRRRRERAGLWT